MRTESTIKVGKWMVHLISKLTSHHWHLERDLEHSTESCHNSNVAWPQESGTKCTWKIISFLFWEFSRSIFEKYIPVLWLFINGLPKCCSNHKRHKCGLEPSGKYLLRVSQQELSISHENIPKLPEKAWCSILRKVLEVCIDYIVSLRSLKQLFLDSWPHVSLITLRHCIKGVLREAWLWWLAELDNEISWILKSLNRTLQFLGPICWDLLNGTLINFTTLFE